MRGVGGGLHGVPGASERCSVGDGAKGGGDRRDLAGGVAGGEAEAMQVVDWVEVVGSCWRAGSSRARQWRPCGEA